MIEYFQRVSDLGEAGSVYLYNFLLDYEDYLRRCQHYVPANQFIKTWTCIPPQSFSYLKQGDTFWYGPTEMICLSNAFESSEGMLMVEAEEYGQYSNNGAIFIAEGDAYCKSLPWICPPEHYKRVLMNELQQSGKESLCQKAVLITKTSPPSS